MLQPLVHMVAASSTHGCSLSYTWLQPLVHMVAASRTHGCRSTTATRPTRPSRPCFAAAPAACTSRRTIGLSPAIRSALRRAARHASPRARCQGSRGPPAAAQTTEEAGSVSDHRLHSTLATTPHYYYYYYLLTSTYLLTTTYYHLPLPGKIVDSSSTRTAIGWQPKYKTFGAFIDTLV